MITVVAHDTRARPHRPQPRSLIVVGVLVAVCITRVLARQATIWEWDDVIFCVALGIFAPHLGTPQAPFYPGFVFLGRVAKLVFGSDFDALTWLSVIASCIALGALYLLIAEWLDDRRVALAGAAIFAFFPAVWFHAGIPLSDPSGLAAALACAWLAVRARRSPGLIAMAGLAFGVAVSIRPQAALIAVAPLVLTLFRLPTARRLAGATASLSSAAMLYIAPIVIAGGGIAGPLRAARYQAGFVMGTDSLAAHGRTVGAVVAKYFYEIWGTWPFAVFVLALAAYGFHVLLRSRRGLLVELLATFLPYAIACWVFLDPRVGGRYALPFLPMFAALMAVGAADLETRLVPGRLPLITGLAVLWPVFMMWQPIRVMHTEPSPPVAAARAIRDSARGVRFGVVFGSGLFPHAQYLFPDVPKVASREAIGASPGAADVQVWWRFGVPEEGDTTAASWPPLAAFSRVGRGRYLTIPLGPLRTVPPHPPR